MLRTKSNLQIQQAVVAVARAQTLAPGFDVARGQEIAEKLDALLREHRTLECTFAVCITLLRLIGIERPADFSRFQ